MALEKNLLAFFFVVLKSNCTSLLSHEAMKSHPNSKSGEITHSIVEKLRVTFIPSPSPNYLTHWEEIKSNTPIYPCEPWIEWLVLEITKIISKLYTLIHHKSKNLVNVCACKVWLIQCHTMNEKKKSHVLIPIQIHPILVVNNTIMVYIIPNS